MADGHLNFDTKIDSSGFSSGMGKITSAAQTALGVLAGNLMTKAVEGIVNIGKEALNSAAALEQNIGGIETLFGDAANTVMQNANNAFKTAGLSANAYMQTATSFAAALNQSCETTAESAEKTQTAITDMSDNANKMGTSMESIQNAYQGFAKQNYTMLDNLKLGYGGTKSEMERLLADAEKIKAKNGEVADYSIDSFSDIVDAIHVVQEEMGITGTTAEETATTIEGSMGMAKAAWDNFLSGAGDASQLVEAVSVAGERVLQAVMDIGGRLVEAAPGLMQSMTDLALQMIRSMHDSLTENGQMLIQSGVDAITYLLDGMSQSIPMLIEIAASVIQNLFLAFANNADEIVYAGVDIITALTSGIVSSLPQIASAAIALFNAFSQALTSVDWVGVGSEIINTFKSVFNGDGVSKFLAAGTKLLGSIVNGILSRLPQVISAAGNIINSILNYILGHLPQILNAGVKILLSIVNGIINNLPRIVSAIASVISKLLQTITSNLPKILQAGITILGKLAAGLIQAIPNLVSKIPQIIRSIKNAFTSIDWGSVGKNIISGIGKGISNGVGAIVNAAKNAAKKALNAAKSFLGIHSPSKVFENQVGKQIPAGEAVGIEKNADTAVEAVNSMNNRLVKSGNGIGRNLAASVAGSAVATDVQRTGSGGIDYAKMAKAMESANLTFNGEIRNITELDGQIVSDKVTPYVDKKLGIIQGHKDRGN